MLRFSSGSEWILEDTIHLKNIQLPHQVDPDVDLSYLHDPSQAGRKLRVSNLAKTTFADDVHGGLKNGGENICDAHAHSHRGESHLGLFIHFHL